jgi:2-keto-4-pentenoate hydratase
MTAATSSSTSIDFRARELAALRLGGARTGRRTCVPVRDLLPAGDVAAAYAVQDAQISQRVAAGARVVGRKIGLTNPAVQRQLGVDQPDFGVLLDDMDCSTAGPISMALLLQPKIEAEIAFVLARDLDGRSISARDVKAATAHVVAALEIVDSRIANWNIAIVDTVADNASSGLFVLGEQEQPLGDLDLRALTMTMWRGEDVVSAGSGADCLGDPLAAVAWLANTVRDYGRPLRAGEVVLSGALGPMVPVAAGDEFRAEIDGIGAVSAAFEGMPTS